MSSLMVRKQGIEQSTVMDIIKTLIHLILLVVHKKNKGLGFKPFFRK